MNQVRKSQIICQQIKLMRSQGPSLGQYCEIHQKTQSFSQASWEAKQASKIIGSGFVKSVGCQPNANLKAFVVILLKIVFERKQKHLILQKIKENLYNQTLQLNKLKNFPRSELSNQNMKKLLVQFFQIMHYGKQDSKVETKLIKYPVILQLLVLYLKSLYNQISNQILFDYHSKLQTSITFLTISQFLSINCTYFMGVYLFTDDGYFISTHNGVQYVYGCLVQSKMGQGQRRKEMLKQQEGQLRREILKQQQEKNLCRQILQKDKRGKLVLQFVKQKSKGPKISFGLCQQNYFLTDNDNINNDNKLALVTTKNSSSSLSQFQPLQNLQDYKFPINTKKQHSQLPTFIRQKFNKNQTNQPLKTNQNSIYYISKQSSCDQDQLTPIQTAKFLSSTNIKNVGFKHSSVMKEGSFYCKCIEQKKQKIKLNCQTVNIKYIGILSQKIKLSQASVQQQYISMRNKIQSGYPIDLNNTENTVKKSGIKLINNGGMHFVKRKQIQLKSNQFSHQHIVVPLSKQKLWLAHNSNSGIIINRPTKCFPSPRTVQFVVHR